MIGGAVSGNVARLMRPQEKPCLLASAGHHRGPVGHHRTESDLDPQPMSMLLHGGGSSSPDSILSELHLTSSSNNSDSTTTTTGSTAKSVIGKNTAARNNNLDQDLEHVRKCFMILFFYSC